MLIVARARQHRQQGRCRDPARRGGTHVRSDRRVREVGTAAGRSAPVIVDGERYVDVVGGAGTRREVRPGDGHARPHGRGAARCLPHVSISVPSVAPTWCSRPTTASSSTTGSTPPATTASTSGSTSSPPSSPCAPATGSSTTRPASSGATARRTDSRDCSPTCSTTTAPTCGAGRSAISSRPAFDLNGRCRSAAIEPHQVLFDGPVLRAVSDGGVRDRGRVSIDGAGPHRRQSRRAAAGAAGAARHHEHHQRHDRRTERLRRASATRSGASRYCSSRSSSRPTSGLAQGLHEYSYNLGFAAPSVRRREQRLRRPRGVGVPSLRVHQPAHAGPARAGDAGPVQHRTRSARTSRRSGILGAGVVGRRARRRQRPRRVGRLFVHRSEFQRESSVPLYRARDYAQLSDLTSGLPDPQQPVRVRLDLLARVGDAHARRTTA